MMSLLYASDLADNASRLSDDDFGGISLLIVIGMTLIWAALLPIIIRQQRRLGRSSDAHPMPADAPA